MKLEGKTAFVTGGASGLGFATAKILIDSGCNVAIADRNEELGTKAAESLGPNALFLHLDITNETSVKESIQRTIERFGGLHILVNCAGVATASMTISSKGVLDFGLF